MKMKAKARCEDFLPFFFVLRCTHRLSFARCYVSAFVCVCLFIYV